MNIDYKELTKLEFPADQNKDELEAATGFLFCKFRAAVNDDQETLSLLNQALGKAMLLFDEKKTKNKRFSSFYSLIGTRLLMNAVRARNALTRIKETASMNIMEDGVLELTYFTNPNVINEHLDLKCLTERERISIYLYYSGYDWKEIADKIKLKVKKPRAAKVTIDRIITRAVKKVRAFLKAKGEVVSNKEDDILYAAHATKIIKTKANDTRNRIAECIRSNQLGKTRYEIADELRIGIDQVNYALSLLEERGIIVKKPDTSYCIKN